MIRIISAVLVMLIFAAPVATAEALRTITVLGQGEASGTPDMATVNLGVEATADAAETALRETSTSMAQIAKVLAEAGIEARDIQTSQLNLSPQWTHDPARPEEPPKMSGYVASNVVAIRVRNLDALGEVLGKLARAGANQIHNIGFGLQDPAPLLTAARRDAIADAIARATLYAEAAGVELGVIQSISDVAASSGGPVPLEMMRGAASDMAVPVASGEATIDATISMVFLIK